MIPKQIIWLNSNIRVQNKLMIHRETINPGLWTIDHLYNDNTLMDINMIHIVYDIDIKWIIIALYLQFPKHGSGPV